MLHKGDGHIVNPQHPTLLGDEADAIATDETATLYSNSDTKVTFDRSLWYLKLSFQSRRVCSDDSTPKGILRTETNVSLASWLGWFSVLTPVTKLPFMVNNLITGGKILYLVLSLTIGLLNGPVADEMHRPDCHSIH